MKNTVKKILALVFVVAMVCSLAVPAFAAEFEKFNVEVIVVDNNGAKIGVVEADAEKEIKYFDGRFEVEVAKADKANVLDVLKAADNKADAFKLNIKNNVVTGVVKGETAVKTDNAFDTEGWVVALNGKPVVDDLSTVAVAKNDVIVVYWADTTIGTKLAMYDDSAIAQGIVSFYYYDAEGTKLPLVGAAVEIDGVYNDLYKDVADDTTGLIEDKDTFVTDEKGQIWIAPTYLEKLSDTAYVIDSLKVKALDEIEEADGYTDAECEYYNDYLEKTLVTVDVVDESVSYDGGMYDVAGATGDMTIVYVLVAAAAVVTLGAVVVMKKKSVKAN